MITYATVLTDEETVNELTEALDALGFEYDADFCAIYGANWKLTGVRAMTVRCEQKMGTLAKMHGETVVYLTPEGR